MPIASDPTATSVNPVRRPASGSRIGRPARIARATRNPIAGSYRAFMAMTSLTATEFAGSKIQNCAGIRAELGRGYDVAAGVRFIRRTRSVNRGSPRNGSNSGSTASSAMYQSRSWYACSSHVNARSVSPNPI